MSQSVHLEKEFITKNPTSKIYLQNLLKYILKFKILYFSTKLNAPGMSLDYFCIPYFRFIIQIIIKNGSQSSNDKLSGY